MTSETRKDYICGMFGLSIEHLIILLVILIVVGPRKLPELGNTLGRTYKNFRDSLTGVEEAEFRKIDESKAEKPEEKV